MQKSSIILLTAALALPILLLDSETALASLNSFEAVSRNQIAVVNPPLPPETSQASDQTEAYNDSEADQANVSQNPVDDGIQAVQAAAAAILQAGGHDDTPLELIVPSIKLDAPIQNVGVNEKGEMDVPDGNSNKVGWYKDGTVPGHRGSAVLDAHVFAAFENLRYVKVGADIYVVTKSGEKLHFVVTDSMLYDVKDVPLQLLFNRSDARRLNLITCAGQVTADGSTYDHRLIIYTKLIES